MNLLYIPRTMSIKEKTSKLQSLIKNINKYFADFTLEDIDVSENLNELNASAKKLDDLEKKEKEEKYSFRTFHLWGSSLHIITDILDYLDDILQRYSKNLLFNKSDTYIKAVEELYDMIQASYNTYKLQTRPLDIKIMEGIKYDNNSVAGVEELTKQLDKYPFAVSLYAYLVQDILHECKDECDQILNIVETAKNKVLYDSNKANTAHLYRNNPHLKTFGLTPLSGSRPLAELTKEVFDSSKSLSGIATEKNACIIVVNKVINKPIEFSLWNLIEWDLINKYSQGDEAGVNAKMIEKFDTLRFHEVKKAQKWNFNVEYHGDIESSSFYVLENLGADRYRILKHTVGKRTRIKKEEMPPFIEHVKNKGVSKNNTRISTYNDIHERKIVENMFLPMKFDVEKINYQSQIVDPTYLRNIIYMRLVNQFTSEYTDKVKSNADVGKLIHSPELYKIFDSIVIEQYDIYTFKNKENVSSFPFSETLKTFLAQLAYLSTQFAKDIHDEFVATKIDQKIYDPKEGEGKKHYLTTMFENILKKVLNKIITSENNIYQSLIYKTSLLKLSI